MTAADPAWRVRPAREADLPEVDRLIRELAAYEEVLSEFHATPEDFRAVLFGPDPRVFCHVAEVAAPDGPVIAGMALWYVSFSTWTGRHGLWLEDLYVDPAHRRLGLGRALLEALAEICVQRDYPRFEWWVLDWNTPAQRFYRSLGATAVDELMSWRVDGTALRELGGRGRHAVSR